MTGADTLALYPWVLMRLAWTVHSQASLVAVAMLDTETASDTLTAESCWATNEWCQLSLLTCHWDDWEEFDIRNDDEDDDDGSHDNERLKKMTNKQNNE